MPLCRINLSPDTATEQHERVRVSNYVVHHRTTHRAANDNRRPRLAQPWQWAVGIAAAPALAAFAMFSGLF
ncbi:hypothetical protein HCU64_21865 [Methylobacterium sp. C25]|nr:hypothetical protein [Methylobacterium sp. C25]